MSANRAHKGLNDPNQLLIAAGLGRALVTNNTGDYHLLHQAWQAWSSAWDLNSLPRHRGILLLHSAPGYDVSRMAEVIWEFVNHLSEGENIDNRAFAWNARLGWHEK